MIRFITKTSFSEFPLEVRRDREKYVAKRGRESTIFMKAVSFQAMRRGRKLSSPQPASQAGVVQDEASLERFYHQEV
jgi:hypothetical protein